MLNKLDHESILAWGLKLINARGHLSPYISEWAIRALLDDFEIRSFRLFNLRSSYL